jgi:membrane protease YdiL (CAAX protease family)
MGGIASAISWAIWGSMPVRVLSTSWPLHYSAGLGAIVGLFFVGFSRFSNARFAWATKLEDNFRNLLGPVSVGAAAWMAMLSAVAEEMVFRGLLLRLLLPDTDASLVRMVVAVAVTALVFGLLHVGPDRSYLPWTAFAIALGLLFGAITVVTGDIVAVVVAHLTINYFNFLAIAGPKD